MKLVDHPERLSALREPTVSQPLRVLVSGCISGMPCGVDGTDYGMGGALDWLVSLPTVRSFPFCPEDHALGTPRTMPDLHGGDGFAVLRGRARAKDERGRDLTDAMLEGGRAMVAFAREHDVELALLTDMSAACGTQVISDGCRFDEPRRYQRGVGVAAALLIEAGIPVCSQRDFATLERLRERLEPGFVADPSALDHHRHPWVLANLGGGRGGTFEHE